MWYLILITACLLVCVWSAWSAERREQQAAEDYARRTRQDLEAFRANQRRLEGRSWKATAVQKGVLRGLLLSASLLIVYGALTTVFDALPDPG